MLPHLRAVVGILALALLVGGMYGQDKKDDKKDKETPTKIKGQLPTYWGKLGLTDEQKQKVYKVQADHRGKIADLEKQIKELKETEKEEMFKVLNDDQKKALKKILADKAGDKDKKDDKKKE